MSCKPNVIYVFSDQHRAQSCGYMGNKDVYTPNMDRMAGESYNFTGAVSGMPVCCPYRATLLTGRYPHHHGVFLNDLCLDTRIPSVAEVFRKNGYDTGYVGKWHLDGHGRENYIPPERRRGFDYWKVLECSHSYQHAPYYEANDTHKKYWEGYDAMAQTEDVIHYLHTRNREKPLFLMLSWAPPHSPYHTAPEEYRKMYSVESISRRANIPLEATQFFRQLPGYYAHITALDHCLGELDRAIEELGMRENTIFIYTSDHGDMIGSQGCYEKSSPWEESIRVPFLLRYPGYKGTPREITAPVEAVDIMPTLLELCGLPVPAGVDGRSFCDLMSGGKTNEREALLQCIQPNGTWHKNAGGREYRGIRTERYTYVEDLNGPWLLYDNEEDCYQMNNLIERLQRGLDTDGGIKKLQKELQKRLYRKMRQAGDELKPGYEYLKQWGYADKVNFMDTIPVVL